MKTRRSSFVTVFCVVKIVCLTCFSLCSESFDPISLSLPLSHTLFLLSKYTYIRKFHFFLSSNIVHAHNTYLVLFAQVSSALFTLTIVRSLSLSLSISFFLLLPLWHYSRLLQEVLHRLLFPLTAPFWFITFASMPETKCFFCAFIFIGMCRKSYYITAGCVRE